MGFTSEGWKVLRDYVIELSGYLLDTRYTPWSIETFCEDLSFIMCQCTFSESGFNECNKCIINNTRVSELSSAIRLLSMDYINSHVLCFFVSMQCKPFGKWQKRSFFLVLEIENKIYLRSYNR